MLYSGIAIAFLIALFSVLLISVFIGRKFGRWKMTRESQDKVEIVTVAEGAIFALLGLLVAFTFTSAYDRFEARKMYIIDEVNAIDTAYFRLDLLAPKTQAPLRQLFRQYTEARATIYKKMPNLRAVDAAIEQSIALQKTIWKQAMLACAITKSESTTELLIPALNNMFEIAKKRQLIIHVHPPMAIFALLIGLAVLSALLTGYSIAGNKAWKSLHILSYIGLIAVVIYVIIDLELPRLGLIRVDKFDQLIMDTKNNME
jgi:hypothetical protein